MSKRPIITSNFFFFFLSFFLYLQPAFQAFDEIMDTEIPSVIAQLEGVHYDHLAFGQQRGESSASIFYIRSFIENDFTPDLLLSVIYYPNLGRRIILRI